MTRPGRHRAVVAPLLVVVLAWTATAVAVAAPVTAATPAVAAVVPAGDEDPPPTRPPAGGGTGNIIPGPNTGTEPQDLGDRGGAGQVGVFVAVCAALVVIAGLAVREIRRARARRPPRR